MSRDDTIKEITHEVLEEFDQSEQFKNRFWKFYQNTINQNIGSHDLRDLIESVELDPEEGIHEFED